jgi:hypothetical protein
MDASQFKKNAEDVVAECKRSPKTTVIQAVEKLASGKL